MRVSWSQGGAADPAAVAQFGTDPAALGATVAAVPSSYTRDDLCGPPATTHGYAPAPWMYSAVLELDVQAGTCRRSTAPQ